ncbi:MAG: PadR family transcriptional regulator [Lachnospiraceae bacterium]|nr:PadR family transcriptional regulator [Lachnospiraceae bacterium]
MVFQLGSALLDSCVLSVLNKGDTYGYVLTQNVKEVIEISESTLYPVLRRLQKDGFLSTYDQPFQGRNRRYYRITDAGKIRLNYYMEEWNNYRDKIENIFNNKISIISDGDNEGGKSDE